jgi:hypothetical protein
VIIINYWWYEFKIETVEHVEEIHDKVRIVNLKKEDVALE